MNINKDGHGFHVVDDTQFFSGCTTDGIYPNQEYRIEYHISGYEGRSASLNFKGTDLIEGYGAIMRLTKEMFGSYDLTQAREGTNFFTSIWASLLIDRSEVMKLRLVKLYGKDAIRTVSKMMRGRGSDWAFLKNMIAGYIYLRKMTEDLSRKFDPDYRVLCVNDCPASDGICSNWEDQPITKRLSISSFEEFQKIVSRGVIHQEWKKMI